MSATMSALRLRAANAAASSFEAQRSSFSEGVVSAAGPLVARRPFNGRALPMTAVVPRVAAAKRYRKVAMAAEDTQAELQKAVDGTIKEIQAAWNKTDDKLAISALAVAAFTALWASIALVGAIDRLPLLPGLLELIGILWSGWFIYRYLLFKPDREELLKLVDEAKGRITGQ